VGDRRLGARDLLHHQSAGDDRQRGGELVRHALVQHLAARGYTPQWYALAWNEFGLPSILLVTVEVVGAVVLISG